MKYDFDQIIPRKNTDSCNYDTAHPGDPAGDIMPLLAADMDFKTLPQITEALSDVVQRGLYGYSNVPQGYFEAVRGWFSRRFGWEPQEEWLLPVTNVVGAIALGLLAQTKPGDAVLTLAPVYTPFYGVIEQNGRRAVKSQLKKTDGLYRVDWEDFERKICENNVKAFLLCSPHNPVGRVWEQWELLRMRELCEAHSVFVIADEIHCDFVYPGFHHVSYAALPGGRQDGFMLCTSASKTFNLALLDNANAFIPDGDVRARIKRQADALYAVHGSYLGQVACRAAYTYGDEWLDQLIDYLNGNMTLMEEFFRSELPEIAFTRPQGTYLAWLNCSALGLADDALEQFILHKAHLRLSAGIAYGEQGKGHMRLNAARPRAGLETALCRLRDAVKGCRH